MEKTAKKSGYGLIMAVYLLGIFMGAIDTGIVTPARTIIQNNLNVDDKTGIWMITIYTLAYAASIPIMGKLADKFGRKYIYLTSIALFGLGSLFCGLSQSFGSFGLLLVARAVQAIGGGGILPVATAEFGTTFPKEKRGMALGLVGGVYGIANIFGASAGSAILDIFGKNNWQFIFYINVPITLFILVAGFFALPNHKDINVKKVDFWGISILTVMVLSLLYGLKNIDFFNLGSTITSTSVYPYLLVFLVLLPVFLFAEKKAEDAVINLDYFKNLRIVITLILSFATGITLMGLIFVPQLAENAVRIASGSGGYFVIVLGLFAGVGAPLSGRLIDKYGVKLILGFGFLISALGSFFIIFITTNYPSTFTVITALILVGLGIGFTIGTPLNYMMLDNTKKEESNSALATLSLIRSIGTAIAPAIMIGFLAHAGTAVQANVMNLLPKEITVSPLPYSQNISDELDALKSNPNMKDKLKDIEMPNLTTNRTIKIDMNGSSGYKLPNDLIELMKSSDVTTITVNCKTLSGRMFAEMTPKTISQITTGIDKGIAGINSGISELDKNISDMQKAYDGISKGISGMQSGLDAQNNALKQLNSMKQMLSASPYPGMTSGTASTSSGQMNSGMPKTTGQMPAGVSSTSGMPSNVTRPTSIVDMIPDSVKSKIPQNVLKELSAIKTMADLDKKISELQSSTLSLTNKITDAKHQKDQLQAALDGMKAAKLKMEDMVTKMAVMKSSVPSTFELAQKDYLLKIDDKSAAIEDEFQKTLNGGFKQVYLTTGISSLIALVILAFYKKRKEEAV